MASYIVRRILTGFITLLGITVITFVVIMLAPGDPAQMQAASITDAAVSERIYQQLREYYNLDKPLYVQYGLWVKRLFTGDFGNSFHDGLFVSRKIREALWPTLSAALLSLILTYVISLPIGIYSPVRQGKAIDRVTPPILYMLYSVPP